MAFIVQMWSGRPSELVVEDMDEDGKIVFRTIPTGEPPDPKRRTFSCHGNNWDLALSLGKAFGWRSKGPILQPFPRLGGLPVREAEYRPDGWIRGIHEVEADDAKAWGAALLECSRAVEAGHFALPEQQSPVLLREGMTRADYQRVNAPGSAEFLRTFAEFLLKGSFRFGWDD